MKVLNKNPKDNRYFAIIEEDIIRVKKIIKKKINPRATMIVKNFIVSNGQVAKKGSIEYKPRINKEDPMVIFDHNTINYDFEKEK